MNYKKIYNQLIARAKSRITDELYYEKHHIVPRCMNGTDDKNNLVQLTPEEHYVAHQLLVKIYPEHNGLAYAALKMTIGSTGRNNNKLYGWIRRKVADQTSETMKKYFKSNPHPKGMLGKSHSLETKVQQSISIRQAFIDKKLTKPVYQFTLKGELITRFDSLQDAAKSVNGNSSNIKYTAEGKFRFAYNHRWSYCDTISIEIPLKKISVRNDMWITDGIESKVIQKNIEIPPDWWNGKTCSKNNKAIYVYKDGVLIGEHQSIKDCSAQSVEKYGVLLYGTNIVKVLKGIYKQYKGFTFMYKRELNVSI